MKVFNYIFYKSFKKIDIKINGQSKSKTILEKMHADKQNNCMPVLPRVCKNKLQS